MKLAWIMILTVLPAFASAAEKPLCFRSWPAQDTGPKIHWYSYLLKFTLPNGNVVYEQTFSTSSTTSDNDFIQEYKHVAAERGLTYRKIEVTYRPVSSDLNKNDVDFETAYHKVCPEDPSTSPTGFGNSNPGEITAIPPDAVPLPVPQAPRGVR